jgi:FkbM family methyltransferase
MLDDLIPRVLARVPISWRRAIIGRPDNPSALATFTHNLLNRRRPANSQVLDCHGPLEGYRMAVDWARFRSLIYGTWEPEVVKVIESVVTPGMTVLDIGGHVGYYTLLFAKLVGPTGKVVAFEPLPENFGALERNIELNALPQVRTVPQALFSKSGEMDISVPEDMPNSGDGSVVHHRGAKTVRVQATTLDEFVNAASLRPDFLKMDVEGAEHDVLLGAGETIAKSHPKMLIELHHFDGNVAANPVPDFLAALGYRIDWIERFDMSSHILALPKA